MSNNGSQRIVEMVNKRREEFISKRSLFERELDTFRTNLEKLTDERKTAIGIDISRISAKELFPSLYEDKFNVDKYMSERAAYGAMMGPVIAVRNELLKQAAELSNGN